jgi:hypothetical protein
VRCFRGRGEGIYDHVFMLGVEALGIGYHLTASPDENSLSTVLTPFTWLCLPVEWWQRWGEWHCGL